MPFNDYLRNSVLNNSFGKTAYTAPVTLYLGLSTAAITDAGTGVAEPGAGAYARIAIPNDKTSWSTATGADNTIDNLIELTFAEATGTWGTMTHFFLSDAVTGGNILVSGPLTAAKAIESGDVARFPAGSITIAIDDL